MMTTGFSQKHTVSLIILALAAWFVPGGGHLLLNEQKRAIVIFLTITLTFSVGLYIGSIGVVDPVEASLWYIAQILNSPVVAALGYVTRAGGYPVYGRPNEIGQIYTSIAGLLNLLCIINAVYIAHARYIGLLEK
jgi:hypothetical protein